MRSASLRVVSPCHEDYGAMQGSGATRFCESCEKSVTNLSAMTRVDAEKFLAANAGKKVCVRYRVQHGELVFLPARAKRLAFVAVLSLAMAACTGYVEGDELDSPEDAALCRDANGYAVPCDAIDEGVIPIDESTPTPTPTAEVDPIPDPTAELGQVQVPIADTPPTGEGCPIPNGDDGVEMGEAPIDEGELMGDIDVSPRMGLVKLSRSEERKSNRAERKQARADKRLARRQR